MKTLKKARRLIGIWALAAAVASLLITVGQDNMSVITALVHPNVWIASLVGALVSIAASPLLTASWNRWYWSALLSLPLGILVVFGFFFLRPHSWQPNRWDAWKSTAMFVDIYPLTIIPACVAAGIIGYCVISDDESSLIEE